MKTLLFFVRVPWYLFPVPSTTRFFCAVHGQAPSLRSSCPWVTYCCSRHSPPSLPPSFPPFPTTVRARLRLNREKCSFIYLEFSSLAPTCFELLRAQPIYCIYCIQQYQVVFLLIEVRSACCAAVILTRLFQAFIWNLDPYQRARHPFRYTTCVRIYVHVVSYITSIMRYIAWYRYLRYIMRYFKIRYIEISREYSRYWYWYIPKLSHDIYLLIDTMPITTININTKNLQPERRIFAGDRLKSRKPSITWRHVDGCGYDMYALVSE